MRAAMSAEARREVPAPTALEDGGRNDDALLASGVLLRFPMTWFPDMLCIIQWVSKSCERKRSGGSARVESDVGGGRRWGIGETRLYSCSDLLTSKEFSTRRAAGYQHVCRRKQGQSWGCVSTRIEHPLNVGLHAAMVPTRNSNWREWARRRREFTHRENKSHSPTTKVRCLRPGRQQSVDGFRR